MEVSSARPANRRLIERDAQRCELNALLVSALDGHGAVAVVLAEAGLGKSALLAEVASTASTAGFEVMTTRCGQLEGLAAFGAIRRLFDRRLMRADAADLEALRDSPARIAVDFILQREPIPAVEQSAMLHAIAWLVEGLAVGGPLLLCVDDAQWADEASTLALASLVDRIADVSVLIVVAAREARPDQRGAAFAALAADEWVHRIRLGPLTSAGVDALLRARIGSRIDDDTVANYADLTGGNPFLLNALVDLVVEHPDAGPVAELVPSGVIDSVVQRLGPLQEGSHRIAQALAVLERAPLHRVAQLADLGLSAATVAAEHLRAAGLLAEEGAGYRGHAELAFKHALLRSAVLETIGVEVRDDLHRRAAHLFAAVPGGDQEASAHLMEATGVGDPWATDLLARSGRAAVAAGAPGVGAQLLARAVAEPASGSVRGELLLELGLAQLRIADRSCVTSLTEAISAGADPRIRARAALGLSTAFKFVGLNTEAVAVLRSALDDLTEADGDLVLSVEAALVAAALLVPAQVSTARQMLAARGALEGDTPGERALLVQAACNANNSGQPAQRIRDLALRAIERSEPEEDNPDGPEWAWARIALAGSGEYDMVTELATSGLRRAARDGSLAGFAVASFVHGLASWWRGDLQVADEHFRAGCEHASATPTLILIEALSTGCLAQTMVELGQVDQATSVLRDSDRFLEHDYASQAAAHLLRARGFVKSASGDHRGALLDLTSCRDRIRAVDADSPSWVSWRSVAIGSLWSLGQRDQARRLAAEELFLAERAQVPRVLGAALRWSGLVAEQGGLDLLERSVEVLANSQARLELARSQIAVGAALRRSGQRARARELLLSGRETAARAGAAVLLAHADDELAAAGSRPRRIATTGLDALTASELRVCRLAASGLRNRDIALRLYITTKTVEIHLSRAYRKLDVRGRDDLAAVVGPDPDAAQF